MIEKIDEQVSVAMVYAPHKGEPWPCIILWKGDKWYVTDHGLHIKYKLGETPFHVYQVVVNFHLHMKLLYNAWNLIWRLEEVSDGQAQ